MKVFQIRENKPQQVMVLPTTAIKGVPKNGIIWAIEHVFVWSIVYEQCVPNMSIRISKK
jgi:CDP-diacylglycerol pyrophosphatase